MFGIGHWEITLLVLVIFILFGHRLPSMMRHLGRIVIQFRDPWTGEFRLRQEPKSLAPISLTEWLLLLTIAALLAALLLPGWIWAN